MKEEYYSREKLQEFIAERKNYLMISTQLFTNKLSILNDESKGIIIITDNENIDLILSNNRKKIISPCTCKTKETYNQESEQFITTHCKSCNAVLIYEKKKQEKKVTDSQKKKEDKKKSEDESFRQKEDLEKSGFEINTIYKEYNVTTCKRMPNNCIDLMVTSPPYDGIRKYKGYVFDFEPLADEMARVLAPGGIIVWNVADQCVAGSESLTSFKQAIYFVEKCKLNLHDTMIYGKYQCHSQNGLKDKRFAQMFEYMFILSKGKPKTANIFVNKNREDSLRLLDHRLNPPNGVRTNIWFYKQGGGHSSKDSFVDHPAIMPEEMAKDHILAWSKENDIVYDPFMGAGTTAKMSILTNRKYIGSEISDIYYKQCMMRIESVTNEKICFEETKKADDVPQGLLF